MIELLLFLGQHVELDLAAVIGRVEELAGETKLGSLGILGVGNRAR